MDSRVLFEILMHEQASTLTAYIRSCVRDESLVDDVWQETMLVAWRRLDEFDRTRPFGPWLRGIAARTILARMRSDRKWMQVENLAELEYLSQRFQQVQQFPGDTLDEKLGALRDCISKLSDNERDCVEGRFLHGLMPAELSRKLSVELETLKKRIQRAKGRLLTCIQHKLSATLAD